MEDDRFQSRWLEEREGEEELFVRVGSEVGCGRGGAEEGGERVGGGFVEALEGTGVEQGAEGGL